MDYKLKAGLAIPKTLVVLGTFTALAIFSYFAFGGFQKNQVLNKEAGKIVSIFEEARLLTLSAQDASHYGVYLKAGGREVVIFRGDIFLPTSLTNQSYFLDESVVISEVNLIGGNGDSVIFSRPAGSAEQHGTVIISLSAQPENSITLAIYPTGAIEVLP